jgi:hypothetical protein
MFAPMARSDGLEWIDQLQAGDVAEIVNVARHQWQAVRQGGGGDDGVGEAHFFSCLMAIAC